MKIENLFSLLTIFCLILHSNLSRVLEGTTNTTS